MWARRFAWAFLAGAAVAAAPAPARADGGPFGLGIILGEPTGLSAKLFLSGQHAVDGALSYSLVDSALYLHADYLLHFSGWILRAGSTHHLLPYLGIGGEIAVRGDHEHHNGGGGIGVRVPFGLAWIPGHLPIDIFLEIAPGLFLLPATDPDLDAGLGLRYFF